MKRFVFLWWLMLLPGLADSLDGPNDLTRQFGPAVGPPEAAGTDPTTGSVVFHNKFRHDGLDISVFSTVVAGTEHVISITISRDSTFSSMEIPDILKTLSPDGDWTQKGDSDWTLSKSKITAHWNGEGRISVGSD